MIRTIQPGEFDVVGALCVDAYVAAGVTQENEPYVDFLGDTQAMEQDPLAEVLVSVHGGHITGTVTICPFGSELTEVCLPRELEFRALAVARESQGGGIAQDLIWACVDWAREHAMDTVVACVTQSNAAGHALYKKLKFVRQPARDWTAPDGTPLQTYALSVQARRFCGRCGQEASTGVHASCDSALGLEPPRYCADCRRRMVVQIVPAGWRARCVKHGDVTG